MDQALGGSEPSGELHAYVVSQYSPHAPNRLRPGIPTNRFNIVGIFGNDIDGTPSESNNSFILSEHDTPRRLPWAVNEIVDR